MPVTKRTYYKALLLLIVFGLNTMVAFACSLGGVFHHFHHKLPVPVEQGNFSSKYVHPVSHKHDHGESLVHKHETEPSGDQKDNCCSGSVIELQKQDKSLTRIIQAPDLVFLGSFIPANWELQSIQPDKEKLSPLNARWRPPTTIHDLRIVIQSFQI